MLLSMQKICKRIEIPRLELPHVTVGENAQKPQYLDRHPLQNSGDRAGSMIAIHHSWIQWLSESDPKIT